MHNDRNTCIATELWRNLEPVGPGNFQGGRDNWTIKRTQASAFQWSNPCALNVDKDNDDADDDADDDWAGRNEKRAGPSNGKVKGVRAIKKFDYLATSDVELSVAALALGDQPIVRPGRCTLLLLLALLVMLVLSVVSGLA